jgi:hypothetical protein
MAFQHAHRAPSRRSSAAGPPTSCFQTVPIRKGRHDSPARGACVMEVASMLAGERFDDHPKSVCPVIAGFLRSLNDLLPDDELDQMYPYAALAVGTAAPRRVRRARARRLLEWADAGRPDAVLRFHVRLQAWDYVVLPAVEAALRMDPGRRHVAVAGLLDELCTLGRPAEPGLPADSGDAPPVVARPEAILR